MAKFLWPIPDRRPRPAALPHHRAGDRGLRRRGRFIPARYAHDYANGIANAEQQIIPGVGHMIPTESPDALNDILNAFLEEHELVV